ncbi:MAG TPA: hypothetical protein VMT29_02880 [Steroidobacteraceae bacterium]|nr:hypothetical protein [Steroidobacteraceae bacterium]
MTQDKPSAAAAEAAAFAGFAALQSNTTYCPNQFFDVVLPNFSRGVVRLVGYVLYRTFAWSDRDGRPMREQHQVSYRELIEQAGISRGALAQAIQEAIEANLLRCVRSGQAAAAGAPAASGVFEPNWNDGEYVTDPGKFQGFFEGAGHRTYIPNQFFTRLLPHEPLSVVKIVGSIIRFSIGFEARRGFRRQQAVLSYRDLHRYSKIASPQDLSRAIQHALEAKYIEQLAPGVFDPNAGRESKAAVYGLKWADATLAADGSGSKSVADTNQPRSPSGSKSVAGQRFRIRSGSGSKSVAGERFKIRSETEIKPESTTRQQQQPAAAGKSDNDNPLAYRRLIEAGFDELAAKRLASLRPLEVIERQVGWMAKRHPARNPLGMLRKAIEEDWPAPANVAGDASSQESPAMVFARHFYAGRAGHDQQPVARPSSADLAGAAALLHALLKISPDPAQAEGWGRQLAQQVAQQQRSDRPAFVTLSLAARLFGDAFVAWVRRDREREARQSASAQREANEARFKTEYLRYLQACEERLQQRDPARYQAFIDHREERRRSLLRVTRNGIQSALLRGFESDAARLEDFRAFFSGAVLDFAGWHAGHNQEGATV